MKLNSKLKKSREREKSLNKSKNKDKHVKIVAEPTKREKQILSGEKPDDYVNTKNNPIALIMRMSRHRQDKIKRINEEYNRQMNLENEAKLKNSKEREKEKDKDIDKDKDVKIEKINKEDNTKQEMQPQQEKLYKKKFRDNEIEVEKETKKEKYFEKNKADKADEEEKEKEKENENENEKPISTKIENNNTRNNCKFRNRYFQRKNTEENKDIDNTKKVYQKREIKFRKPIFLEEKSNMNNNSLNANKNIGNDRQILTDMPGYDENKKDDKINDSINKRFFKLNKTRYFNRDENNKKPDIRNKIEKINNYSNKVNSSFNKVNIREENNNDLNNDYYNNYNTEDQTKKNTNNSIISYKIKAQDLKNSRSNNDVLNNNEENKNNNNKEGEIKKTDTKVYVSKRPAIIYDKEKIFNTIDTILENDNNNPRKIKIRNVIRNNIYKREINNNIINKTEKEKQEENNDNKNNESFNSRRRRYDVSNKVETEYKEKDNKENNDILDKLEYRGTRNKKNSVINNYKTSYDNVKVDRKEKIDLSVDKVPNISEENENQDNSAIHSYRRRYQSITRGIKNKNEQNKVNNNVTSVDNILPKWRKKQVINIENQDKDKDKDKEKEYKASFPFRRKFVNVTRSFDPVLKRVREKENDDDKNEKNNDEQQPEEKEKVERRYENIRINNYTKVERDNRNNDISKDKLDNEEVKRHEEQREEEEGIERNRKRKRLRYQRYYNNINWKVDNSKELNKSSDISTLRKRSNI